MSESQTTACCGSPFSCGAHDPERYREGCLWPKPESQTTCPEVTDAMVNAALNAWYKMDKAWKGDSSLKRDMRDAIAAALKELEA